MKIHRTVEQLAIDMPRWWRAYAFIGLLFVANPQPGAAQSWQPVGPEGGSVLGLAVDPARPSTAFASSAGNRLWRTTNGGRSWEVVGAGYRRQLTYSIVIDGRVSGRILTAGGGGILLSKDGGESWAFSNRGLPFFQGDVLAFNLVAAPSDSRTLYTQAVTAKGYPRVFASTDSGRSWHPANGDLPVCNDANLAVHPSQPAVVIIGCGDGLYRSWDGGRKWQALGGAPWTRGVLAVAFDSFRPSRVYVTVQPSGAPQAATFFVSQDTGTHWKRAGDGLPALAQYAALSPSSTVAETLLVGSYQGHIMRSTDGGLSFQPASDIQASNPFQNSGVDRLVADPLVAGRWWAAVNVAGHSAPGIFKTTNSGRNWRPFVRGMRAVGAREVSVSRVAEGTLVASSSGERVSRTTDGGATWTSTVLGSRYYGAAALLEDPVTPGTYYAGTQSRVYRSPNAADTWEKWPESSSGPTMATSISASALEPRDFYVFGNQGLHVSHDGGSTWVLGPTPLPVHLVLAAPNSSSLAYALGFGCFRGRCMDTLLRSTDGGMNWAQASGFFPLLDALVVDVSDPTRLYGAGAGLGAAVLVLSQGGAARQDIPVEGAEGGLTALVQDPLAPYRLVVGTAAGEVWETEDGGQLWSQVGNRLAESITDVALDPFAPDRVYAATPSGIFSFTEP